MLRSWYMDRFLYSTLQLYLTLYHRVSKTFAGGVRSCISQKLSWELQNFPTDLYLGFFKWLSHLISNKASSDEKN